MTSAAARTGRANEDFAGAVPTAAVLLDGAGIPGAESVCRHGVAWYASRLGGSLLSLLSLVRDRSLPALVMAVLASRGPAEVIHRVRQAETRLAVAADDATIAHCTDLGGS